MLQDKRRVAIEYERSVKSKARYKEIREAIRQEAALKHVLYFADNESVRTALLAELIEPMHSVGVVSSVELVSLVRFSKEINVVLVRLY